MTQSTRLSETQGQASNATTKIVPPPAPPTLYYTNQQNYLADLKNFDLALDEKNPQPEYLASIFDHAELQQNFLDDVLELCEEFKNDDDLPELKMGQFINQSLFGDNERMQEWVAESVLGRPASDDKLEKVIIRILEKARAVIFNLGCFSSEFMALYPHAKGALCLQAARRYPAFASGHEYVACLFENGIISLLCRKLSQQLGSQHKHVSLFIELMKHQLNTNQNFIKLFADAKKQSHDHDLLSHFDSVFCQFIKKIESCLFKQWPYVDSGKYIPLLTLAVNVMQLPKESFAYGFGMRELILLIKQFEEINQFPEVEKNVRFNQELIQPLLLVISNVTEPDPSKNQIRAKNAAVIFNHHINYLDAKLKKIDFDSFSLMTRQVYSLPEDSAGLYERATVEATEEKLRKLRNVVDFVDNKELQKEIITYLLGPRNKYLHGLSHGQYKSADVIIEDIIENRKNNDYKPEQLINLFRLINAISASPQHNTDEERKQLQLVLNHLIYQYKIRFATINTSQSTKEITKSHFVWICDELYEYYKWIIPSVVDNLEYKEQKSSVSLSSEMFKCYRDMLAITAAWNDETLNKAVKIVGQVAVVPVEELFEPMKLVHAAVSDLNELDWYLIFGKDDLYEHVKKQTIAAAEANINELLLIQKPTDGADAKAIAPISDNYQKFKTIGWYLEHALLTRQMKLDNETDLANQVQKINLLTVDLTYYRSVYNQLQSLNHSLDKRTDLLAIAAKAVLQDARAEFKQHLIALDPAKVGERTRLQMLLPLVNNLVGPNCKYQDLKSLTNILNASIPEISTQRALYSSLCIFAGIATLALGFALSPMTSFTLAYLSIEAASVLMAAGVAAIVGTVVTLWQAKQPTGVAASLGRFIESVNKNVKFDNVNPGAVVDQQALPPTSPSL